MIAVPLPKSPLVVVRDVGHLLLRLPRPLRSQVMKHQKRNDRDSEGIEYLDVHVDVEVVGVEVVDVVVVEVVDVEVEDAVKVDQGRVQAVPVEDSKVAEEALVDVGKGKDVVDKVDMAPYVKLQVEKTSMLLI